MFPVLPGGISSYSVMISIGLAVSALYNYFRLAAVNLTFKKYMFLGLICAIFAILFSKVFFAISYLPIVGISFHNLLYHSINGGFSLYGALFGFCVCIYIYSMENKQNGNLLLDHFAPSIPLFFSIARIGCLLGGCCYGIPWHWGITMVESPHIVRFPAQIAESLCHIVIFVILIHRTHKNKSEEGNFQLFLLLYAFCRFVLEFFRGDNETRGIFIWGLSFPHIVSIIILLAIVTKYIVGKKWHYVDNR